MIINVTQVNKLFGLLGKSKATFGKYLTKKGFWNSSFFANKIEVPSQLQVVFPLCLLSLVSITAGKGFSSRSESQTEELRKEIPLLELKWATVFGNGYFRWNVWLCMLVYAVLKSCYCVCWWIISFDKVLQIHLYVWICKYRIGCIKKKKIRMEHT